MADTPVRTRRLLRALSLVAAVALIAGLAWWTLTVLPERLVPGPLSIDGSDPDTTFQQYQVIQADRNELRSLLVQALGVLALVIGAGWWLQVTWNRRAAIAKNSKQQRHWRRWLPLLAITFGGLGFLYGILVALPPFLVPFLSATPFVDSVQTQNEVRGTLLQGIGSLAILTSLGCALWVSSRQWRPSIHRSTESLRQRAERLSADLARAMAAVAATEEEVQERIASGQSLVARLERDAELYEELAQVNQAQAEAIAMVVRGEVTREGRRSLWTQIGVNVAFFLAGIIFTVLLGN